MIEAKLIGFKEGIKVAVVWLVFYSYLVAKDRKDLIKPFNIGLVTSLFITILAVLLPGGFISGEHLANIIAMSFALFLIASAAALLHASGTNLFGPFSETPSARPALHRDRAGRVMVFLVTLIFFLPDFMGSVLFMKELAFMRDAPFTTYAYASAGTLFAAFIIYLVIRLYRPYWIGDYFDIPQLLLFLAIVKLMGGGTNGITELSLVPSVQTAFMKFIHDVVHQVLVLNMVPDHLLLKTTVWNFIGIFFGADLASAASLVILLFFPLMFMYYRLFRPAPDPEARTNVQRRKIKSRILSDRRKKALPVIFFIGLILTVWFSQRGETISRLYVPKPRPVVASRGGITIPLNDPTMDLMNGSLHKFVFIHEGEEIRILAMKKPDNTLSVSLDACEVCPPEGYGQREDHLVCLYCGTPLQIESFGSAGGCNPIPLTAETGGGFIRIEVDEILGKWGFMKAGAGRGGVR